MSATILIVDDEENICFTLGRFLSDEGYQVTTAQDFDTALQKIQGNDFDLVFVDILLKGQSGLDILKRVKQKNPNCPVVMITGVPTVETASEAVRIGAFDYLPKPVLQDALLKVTGTALTYKHLIDEKQRYESNLEAIFSSVKDALISVDKNLNIIEINKAAEKICSLSKGSAEKKSLRSLDLDCDGQCIKVLEQSISSKKTLDYSQITCNHKKNIGQVVNITASPLLDPKGNLTGGLLAVRDRTRLARLEKNLKMRRKYHNIIGKNESLQKIFSLIDMLADVKTTVLISGESGTGKELVADAIHFKSNAPENPFVKVNCAALSENLLESELFGHVKGAFSGAVRDRTGRFEQADGGSIFLDEVGEMTPKMQVKLLRVLQEKEFERVGDCQPIKVDLRVITATNRDLKKDVADGRFRQDLYYRLKVVEIKLLPLQQRREDIPLLVDHFIETFNDQFKKQITGVSDDVRQAFMQYAWPGNVRELQHAIEHAFILCPSHTIELSHLPVENQSVVPGTSKEKLLTVLDKTRWNKTKAAKDLNISRQNLYRKMKTYKISTS